MAAQHWTCRCGHTEPTYVHEEHPRRFEGFNAIFSRRWPCPRCGGEMTVTVLTGGPQPCPATVPTAR
jgi:hypothetical protein